MMTTERDNLPTLTGTPAAERVPLVLSDGTTLDDVIGAARHGDPARADELRREVEAYVLAPAHAVLVGDHEALDDLVTAIAGHTFDRGQRCEIAVELLLAVVMRAVPAGVADMMMRLPDTTGAPNNFRLATQAVGMIMNGMLSRNGDLVDQGHGLRRSDDDIARDMVLVLSLYLAGTWREVQVTQHQALASYTALAGK